MKINTVNPYSEETLLSYNYIVQEKIEYKINSSHDAFLSWKHNNFKFKNNILKSINNNLKLNIEKYALLITQEMGKPIKESVSELKKCSLLCDYYLKNSEKYLLSNYVDLDDQIAEIFNEPLGVILGIMPWNFPFWQVFRFAIPAIMAGNTVMIKHSPNTFGCGEAINQLFIDSDCPENVFTSLIVNHIQVESIISNNKIKAVSLTGSDKTGSEVGAIAGKYLKKTLFELGGSDPFIVYPDANIDLSIKDAVAAKFLNCGQSCISPKRFFIHEKIYKEFVTKFLDELKSLNIGDPKDKKTDIGPLAKMNFVKKVDDQVNKSIELGAEVIYKHKYSFVKGFFYQPIVIKVNNPKIPIFKEEVFGPVVPIYKFKNKENILTLVNDTEFGLGASLWTKSEIIIKNFRKNINSGALFINGMTKSDPRIPFGGVKKSGYGRELSIQGIQEFINIKTIVKNKEE